MNFTIIFFIALSLCWTLSPDGLLLLGNIAGQGGPWSLLLFIGAVALFLPSYRATPSTQNRLPQVVQIALTTLTLSCYLGLALFIPTGNLVTAGFTFNETFVYWFPNFGFAFLLLGLVLVCHLVGGKVPKYLQVLSTILVLINVIGLALVGIFTEGDQQLFAEKTTLSSNTFSLFPLALLLFLGGQGESDNREMRRAPTYTVYLPLFIALLFTTLWSSASLLHVPQSKLADSSIPYIIGAREILGQPGRIIMGVAIIAGAVGVLNGLLILFQQNIHKLALQFELKLGSAAVINRVFSVLICAGVGYFMASGLAGYEKLEVYIYTALSLWLLLTALTTFIHCREQPTSNRFSRSGAAAALIILPASIYLLCTGDTLDLSLRFLSYLLSGSFAVSIIWFWLSRLTGNQQQSLSPKRR